MRNDYIQITFLEAETFLLILEAADKDDNDIFLFPTARFPPYMSESGNDNESSSSSSSSFSVG